MEANDASSTTLLHKPYLCTVSHKKNANQICTGCSRRKSGHSL